MNPPRYESQPVDVSALAAPLKFDASGQVAFNRLMKASTTERISSWEPKNLAASGIPTANLINVYKRWAGGGYGVICTGNIMVAEDHLEAPGNMIIPTGAEPVPGDERFEAYRRLAAASKTDGALVIAQLNHPGRQTKAELQANPVSASAVKLDDTLGMKFNPPHAATKAEIQNIIAQFVDSSYYMEKSGFDGVQLHVAHGYLLSQFLARSTNQRTDEYGGSLANRARLLMEVIRGIRNRLSKGFIVSLKLNSVEFQAGGFSVAESKELCSILEEQHSIDFIELSGGTYESLAFSHKRETTIKREAFFLEFAQLIAPSLTTTRTYITGGFKTAAGMVGALGTVDGVGLARVACLEFEFGRSVLDGKTTGAIKQKLDPQNFMLTNVAAGTQIGQVGQGNKPIDLSSQENADLFLKAMGVWVQQLGEDKEMKMSGYIDMSDIRGNGSLPPAN
jgi:2,4-dienoyl-CoA reductase-like NADH-dependent reductase (Old Yellow Enzyme family)